MARPCKVVLHERDLESAEEAHDLLARALQFPAYYGANLDALEDCLGDISRPTRIVLWRDPEDPKPWFDDLTETIASSAQASCFVGCTLREEDEAVC